MIHNWSYNHEYRKLSSIYHHPPPRELLISNTFEERLIETRRLFERGGRLFNLAKMVVSVLHKELQCKVEKLKYKALEVMQPRINNKSARTSNTWIDHPGVNFTVVLD